MAANDKDTIYIDIDDEITGIIDKVKNSSGKVTALVLPKRATTLQSIVNMKLLKRAADDADKNLVLITSEAGLLPLAGAAGVHVAKTLTSKPAVPLGPQLDDHEESVEETELPITAETAGDKPIGQLAGLGTAVPLADDVETVELDDDVSPEDLPATEAPKPKTFQPAGKKNKKLAVPNFERFRLWLVLGALILILLIGGFIFAAVALPKATIKIKTDATNVNASLNLNLSTGASSLDPSSNTVPAKLEKLQKTYTEQVPTTGQKNNGSKATGTVTMTAKECGTVQQPDDVPAGTGVSANGLTYITQADTSFSSSPNIKGNCLYFAATSDTAITAQSGGANYNTGNGSSFSVAGRSDVSASGSASGGTDNIVQVVNQNDINNAKAKINPDENNIKQTLKNQLQQDNYYAIAATYNAATPSVTSSANVGDQASNVTVTETVAYTMFGAHQDDLKTLIDNSVKDQIDTTKQSILDEGLSSAIFSVNSSSSTGAQLSLQATAVAGPQLNTDSIKQAAAGKKAGEVKSDLTTNPDVTSVDVKFSPFWVSSVPKNTKRITVTIAKPQHVANKTNSNASQ